jgi:transposase-like protein
MPGIARKSDGRRIFTDEFKRKQIDRVTRGDLTLAELSRKLGIARSLLQRWKRSMPLGADLSAAVRGHSGPMHQLPNDQYIRELQLLVGKQTVELELLRTELDALKLRRRSS